MLLVFSFGANMISFGLFELLSRELESLLLDLSNTHLLFQQFLLSLDIRE